MNTVKIVTCIGLIKHYLSSRQADSIVEVNRIGEFLEEERQKHSYQPDTEEAR